MIMLVVCKACVASELATDGADTSRILFASDRAIILVAHLFCSFAVRRHECAMPDVGRSLTNSTAFNRIFIVPV